MHVENWIKFNKPPNTYEMLTQSVLEQYNTITRKVIFRLILPTAQNRLLCFSNWKYRKTHCWLSANAFPSSFFNHHHRMTNFMERITRSFSSRKLLSPNAMKLLINEIWLLLFQLSLTESSRRNKVNITHNTLQKKTNISKSAQKNYNKTKWSTKVILKVQFV